MQEDIIKCPVFQVLTVFEKRWSLAILKEIYKGTNKFNEIKRKLKGINPSILSRRLAELEKKGLISRKVSQEKPVTVTYSLTERTQKMFACWPKER